MILILGSSGVIGKSLYNYLRSLNYDVSEYDIKISESHDLRISCPNLDDYDFIFFLAYDLGGSKYLFNSQLELIENNSKIMENVFNELKKCKKPFLFASSQMQNMYNPYGTLKRLGEHYTEILGGISIRFWNVYGHEEISIKSHVIPDFIDQYKTKGFIQLMTDGQEERQFLYTDDCSIALERIMKNYKLIIQEKGHVIDVAYFKWTKIIDIAKIILEINSDDVNKIKISEKKDFSHTTHCEPDTYILKFWEPKISLQEGITKLFSKKIA